MQVVNAFSMTDVILSDLVEDDEMWGLTPELC